MRSKIDEIMRAADRRRTQANLAAIRDAAERRRARAVHASNVRHDRAEHGEHVTLRGDTVERDAALVERLTLAESDPWSAGQ